MAIEWGNYPQQSGMSMQVLDNTGSPPTTVLDTDQPFQVKVRWSVPAAEAAIIGGSFRIRVFAESMGPGQEKQVGATLVEPALPHKTDYEVTINGGMHELQGEGELTPGGERVAGLYRFTSVLQHLNPGPNKVSGYCDGPLVQFRTP